MILLAAVLPCCGPAGIVTLLQSPDSGPGIPPPDFPTGFTATPAGTDAIELQWHDVEGETGYSIERKPQSAGDTEFRRIATPAADVTSFADTGLTAGFYEYRIQAVGPDAQSVFSPSVRGFTLPEIALQEPIGGEVVDLSTTPLQSIRWATSLPNLRIRIQLSQDSGATFQPPDPKAGSPVIEVDDAGSVTWSFVRDELQRLVIPVEDLVTCRVRVTPLLSGVEGASDESGDFELFQMLQPTLFDVDFAGLPVGLPPPPRGAQRPPITTVDIVSGQPIVQPAAAGLASVLQFDSTGARTDAVRMDLGSSPPNGLHQARSYRLELALVVDSLSGNPGADAFTLVAADAGGAPQFNVRGRRSGASQNTMKVQFGSQVFSHNLDPGVPASVRIEWDRDGIVSMELTQGASVETRSSSFASGATAAVEISAPAIGNARFFVDDIRLAILVP